jgi:hypothetical protein
MKLSSFLMGATCALALSAGAAQAQSKLTTLFAANNGGSIGGIVYFDITVKSGAVIITGFETNCDQVASTPIGLDVYTCPTTYIGNEGTQASWTQVATDDGNAVSAGDGDVPSTVMLQSALTLSPGTYGMALVAKGFGHDYTNGDPTNIVAEDAFLRLDLGAAYNTPWGSSSPFSPRIWNGSVIYNPASGIYANFKATPLAGKSPLQVQFRDTDLHAVTRLASRKLGVGLRQRSGHRTRRCRTRMHKFSRAVGYDVKYTASRSR